MPTSFLILPGINGSGPSHWQTAWERTLPRAHRVVAPDPAGTSFPGEAAGFSPVPMAPLPFPSVLIASSNDPYADGEFSHRCAATWGARWVDAGPGGHLNADSGLGDWPEGRRWLATLTT